MWQYSYLELTITSLRAGLLFEKSSTKVSDAVAIETQECY